MANFKVIFISLILILLVISAGCTILPPSSPRGSTTDHQSGKSPYSKTKFGTQTTVPTPTPTIFPSFKINQIALKSSGVTSGLAIVDYNSDTQEYGTLPVTRNSKGAGWHTKGYQLIEWKKVSQVDEDYPSVLSFTVPPNSISDHDPTRPNLTISSEPCYLAGDWSVNKGASIYKFRLDGIVVNLTGNQTLIGQWTKIRSTAQAANPRQDHEGYRTYVIRWNYGPSPDSANYMDKLIVSSDCSKISGVNNYGNKSIDGTWIGLVPSWKGEAMKAKSETERNRIISSESDCTKWFGGGEWYNELV